MQSPTFFRTITLASVLLFGLSQCSNEPNSFSKYDYAMESAEEATQAAMEMESSARENARPKAAPALGADAVLHSAVSRTQTNIDSSRQLVRRANLRFKSNNVLQAALEVEAIAQKNGGFVLENNYNESQRRQHERRVSRDSVEIEQWVAPNSSLEIRVPFQQLDSTLGQIGRLALVIDVRNLSAQDIGFDWMEQHLAVLRSRSYGETLATDITKKGDQLADITAARQRAFQAQTAEDIAKIEQLRMADLVKFSTISVQIYQEDVARYSYVAFQKEERAWRPNVFARIGTGLASGWYLFEDLLTGLATLWPFFLLFGVLFIAWRKWRA